MTDIGGSRKGEMISVIQLLKDNPNYILAGGIPRQKAVYSPDQKQTAESFGFKWGKRDTYESPNMGSMIGAWLDGKYRIEGLDWKEWIAGKKVLDAGCGAGYSALLLFGEALNVANYIGVDISTAVDVAKTRFAERGVKGEFVQASLMDVPAELGNFDVIFSEGVLHHTDSTEKAVKTLATRLNPGGMFMFYVYNKKGPIREFTDDYIRDKLLPMSDEQAWEALKPLSKLGKKLGELGIELDIEEPIDLLGIPAGRVDLQRLFYYHVMKSFYRPDWTLEEMNHINFDWFRPNNCHRQTPGQLESWCADVGLKIARMAVEESGITVVARKG